MGVGVEGEEEGMQYLNPSIMPVWKAELTHHLVEMQAQNGYDFIFILYLQGKRMDTEPKGDFRSLTRERTSTTEH